MSRALWIFGLIALALLALFLLPGLAASLSGFLGVGPFIGANALIAFFTEHLYLVAALIGGLVLLAFLGRKKGAEP